MANESMKRSQQIRIEEMRGRVGGAVETLVVTLGAAAQAARDGLGACFEDAEQHAAQTERGHAYRGYCQEVGDGGFIRHVNNATKHVEQALNAINDAADYYNSACQREEEAK